MDEAKFARWGLLSGVGFTVAVLISGFIGGTPPLVTDSDKKIFNYLNDNADRLKIGSYLGGIAIVLFLWFLGSLYGRMRPAEGATGRMSRVALMGGTLAGALALAGNAINSSAALRPNPGAFRVAVQFFGYVGFGLAVFTAAVSIVIWNSGLLPKWIGYLGEVIAIGWFVGAATVATEKDAVAIIGFVVFGVWAIWVALVSVMLYRTPEKA